MPKGSVVLYLGSTWHGGGANQSNAPRMGLVNTYCLGWLRPESNMFLKVPPEIAARYGPHVRALLGYMPHGATDDLCGAFSATARPGSIRLRERRGALSEARSQQGKRNIARRGMKSYNCRQAPP